MSIVHAARGLIAASGPNAWLRLPTRRKGPRMAFNLRWRAETPPV